MPYHKEVIARIKRLPEWAWTYDAGSKNWIVDRAVWPHVKVVLADEWGESRQAVQENRARKAKAANTHENKETPTKKQQEPPPASLWD